MKSFKNFKAELEEQKDKVEEPTGELKKACWKGYTAIGMKMKNGRKVPNCVPVKEESSIEEEKNPTTVKHSTAVKFLGKLGYELHRQSGRHMVFKHPKSQRSFALPGQHSKEVSPALTRQLFALAEEEGVDESTKQQLKSYMIPAKEGEGVDFSKIKHHNKFVRKTLNKLRKVKQTG